MRYAPEDFPWRVVLRSGQPLLGSVMGVTRRDGTAVWTRVNAVPLGAGGGAPEGVLVTFQDITVERAAVKELAEAAASLERRVAERTAALEKTNRELEAFAHSVSHDLRAPLRAINGFARLLADREGARLDSESRRLLSRIEAGAGRMGELIDDVIAYSGATRREPVIADVDLDRTLRSIVARLAQAYPATRFDVSPLSTVRGDARMLDEILLQLLGNALKFSAHTAEPRVRVWAETGADGKTVHVADNGAGFDMAHSGHLFHLFRRLHHEHEFPGTGVGLATVRNLVERQGGEVYAQGEPGVGARFSFRLPAG
jgi:signal transduction histidine kinase